MNLKDEENGTMAWVNERQYSKEYGYIGNKVVWKDIPELDAFNKPAPEPVQEKVIINNGFTSATVPKTAAEMAKKFKKGK